MEEQKQRFVDKARAAEKAADVLDVLEYPVHQPRS
jgi:hypothetical protein